MKTHTIRVPFMLGVTVNCYIIEEDSKFTMIDTGARKSRHLIEEKMNKIGCTPENLNLIILTHGDFDHCGNAKYFAKKFNAKIALHKADLGMVEQGNMFYNRKQPLFLVKWLINIIMKLPKKDRFTPDIILEDLKNKDQLVKHGLDFELISIPGHSAGSIGIITKEKDLFCGDLLANRQKPAVWGIVDDKEKMLASAKKVKSTDIRKVYPGHGRPFFMKDFEVFE